jgi:ribosome-associated translation inhibitor RaiA
MSTGIQDLTEKVKAAHIELERVTAALYQDVHDPQRNAAYNHALLALDRAEDELDRALTKFKRKKF